MRFLLIVSFVSLLLPFSKPTVLQTRELSQRESIELAESAVLKNGCTDLAPLRERPILSFERDGHSFAFFHTMECKARDAFEGKPNGRPGWTVVFFLENWCVECSQSGRYRAVTMNKDGSDLRLERWRVQRKRVSSKAELPRNTNGK